MLRDERATRSPKDQLIVLDQRLGVGVGAKRERTRLNKLVNKTNDWSKPRTDGNYIPYINEIPAKFGKKDNPFYRQAVELMADHGLLNHLTFSYGINREEARSHLDYILGSYLNDSRKALILAFLLCNWTTKV